MDGTNSAITHCLTPQTLFFQICQPKMCQVYFFTLKLTANFHCKFTFSLISCPVGGLVNHWIYTPRELNSRISIAGNQKLNWGLVKVVFESRILPRDPHCIFAFPFDVARTKINTRSLSICRRKNIQRRSSRTHFRTSLAF